VKISQHLEKLQARAYLQLYDSVTNSLVFCKPLWNTAHKLIMKTKKKQNTYTENAALL